MPAVDAGPQDLRDDSMEPQPGEGDAAAVRRHIWEEVTGLIGGREEGNKKVPVGAVGAHDPDRAVLEKRQALSEHDVPAVGGIPGLEVATSWHAGSKLALAGSIGIHDPDAAHEIRQGDPG